MTRPTQDEAEAAIATLLQFIDPDPERTGLRDTPARVIRAWQEWTAGYTVDVEQLLAKSFDDAENYDQMIVLPRIRVESTCEHHLAPIIGVAIVGYVPRPADGGKVCVVGLSKLPAVVEAFAKRLQIQERMTKQIAGAIEKAIDPLGVAVLIEAQHHCVCTRGVHQTEMTMITSDLRGVFRQEPETRAEFMALARRGALL